MDAKASPLYYRRMSLDEASDMLGLASAKMDPADIGWGGQLRVESLNHGMLSRLFA
jgi:hypothetical protein